MKVCGTMYALGAVAALAIAGSVSKRGGSANAMQIHNIEGISLEVPEVIADRAESAWQNNARRLLRQQGAAAQPTRAHYRTLANHLEAEVRRRAPRTRDERSRHAEMLAEISALREIAAAVDMLRGGRAPSGRPRKLNPGDVVRARGKIVLKGMREGDAYMVHMTPTRSGEQQFVFRRIDALGRPSQTQVGPFSVASVQAFVIPSDALGMGLVIESIAPTTLEG
jgi:hypothetical protein